MIEPISAIALAVAAGAAAASKDVAAKAIKDAYNGLITLIKDVYRNHLHVQESVDQLEKSLKIGVGEPRSKTNSRWRM
jgi:hypothetical protein